MKVEISIKRTEPNQITIRGLLGLKLMVLDETKNKGLYNYFDMLLEQGYKPITRTMLLDISPQLKEAWTGDNEPLEMFSRNLLKKSFETLDNDIIGKVQEDKDITGKDQIEKKCCNCYFEKQGAWQFPCNRCYEYDGFKDPTEMKGLNDKIEPLKFKDEEIKPSWINMFCEVFRYYIYQDELEKSLKKLIPRKGMKPGGYIPEDSDSTAPEDIIQANRHG